MLATLLFTVTAFSVAPIEAAEIRLRSTVNCTTAVVRLTDIADIVDAEPRLAQALAEVPICPAPAAGTERSLSQNDVRQLLAVSGLEYDRYRVAGHDAVTIRFDAAAPAIARRPLIASGVRQAIFTQDVEEKIKVVRPATATIAPAAAAPKSSAAALVERNAVVTVIARTAGVRITASGKALEAGAAGDAINIELADTKQRVLARVTGPQTVELASPGL